MESALHAVAGRKRWGLEASQKELLAALRAVGAPEDPQSEMDEPATISLC